VGEGEADDGGTGSGSKAAGSSSKRSGAKGQRRCRVCGERGHNKRTCPQGKVIDAEVNEEVAKVKAVEAARAGKAKAADSESGSSSGSSSE
jgi:hypothetical protein